MSIRFGSLVKVSNDKGPHKIATVQSDGKEYQVKIFELAGMESGHAPGSDCVIIPINGDIGEAIALVGLPTANRQEGQVPGEITNRNNATGSEVRQTKDGNITITAGKGGRVNINP